jgi:hypothetical protein
MAASHYLQTLAFIFKLKVLSSTLKNSSLADYHYQNLVVENAPRVEILLINYNTRNISKLRDSCNGVHKAREGHSP